MLHSPVSVLHLYLKVIMTRFYLFIDAGKVVDESTAFYRVGIGTSKRDVTCFRQLARIATTRGSYFHRWDNSTSDFLTRCIESVYGGSNALVVASHLIPIKCRELVKVLEGRQGAKPLQDAVKQASHLLRFQSLNYRLACMAGDRKGANVAHVENLSK